MGPGPSAEVYLLPAVVGGGVGDIEEVLAAGRRLSRAGFPILLYRARGQSLPRSVDGPWAWPRHRRVDSLYPRAPWAVTLSASWGIAAAPARAEPYGRPGPWATEATAIERKYGVERTLHVSFEEFARTLTSREQTVERWREGGLSRMQIRRRMRGAASGKEIARFHSEYVKFRAFDQPNLLHLFTSFRFSSAFAREFPDAVQTGPLWPDGRWERKKALRTATSKRYWVWYASPSTSVHLLPRVLPCLRRTRPPVLLVVQSPHARFDVELSKGLRLLNRPVAQGKWRNLFEGAELRIVTGSRTLLEALEFGRPFLYFNGVLGRGSRSHRHRPEKIQALLATWRRQRRSPLLLSDLEAFSRAHRVEDVVCRAIHHRDGWGHFPRFLRPLGFSPRYEDGGRFLESIVRSLAVDGPNASEIVRSARTDQRWLTAPRVT